MAAAQDIVYVAGTAVILAVINVLIAGRALAAARRAGERSAVRAIARSLRQGAAERADPDDLVACYARDIAAMIEELNV